jgi:hypothetical protein
MHRIMKLEIDSVYVCGCVCVCVSLSLSLSVSVCVSVSLFSSLSCLFGWCNGDPGNSGMDFFTTIYLYFVCCVVPLQPG